MKTILSALMAAVLMLTGCAGPGGASSNSAEGSEEGLCDLRPAEDPAFLRYALAQPVYPEFPRQPVMPLEGPEGAWEAYEESYSQYLDALLALRGEDPNLTEGERSALSAFAGRSTALVLEGYEGENTVYSPLSLWSALAMQAQCANGDTRQQLLDAIGAASVDQLQGEVSHIWRTLYTDDGLSALILSNSIWLNSAMEGTYVQATLNTLTEKYFAGAYAIPMGTDEADQAVSDWVREQTQGLIGGNGPVVRTAPDILALLVSSLYYKAAWTDGFSAARTEIDTFTGADGQESRVDFMHQTRSDLFLRREGWQAARLRTQLGEMVFVLPDEGIAPESLLQDPDFLADLEFSVRLDFPSEEDAARAPIWGEVQWSVPKFDVKSELALLNALKRLGVTDLLDREKADLSALTDLDAYLSDARQLTRVKVDEEGVEAAAVTILTVAPTSAMPEPDPEVCVMDLDRPFLFVIRTHQGVPLFVGVVNEL